MWKKIMSILMVVALALTTINYIPSKISASQSDAQNVDWSTVEYVKTSGECSEYADTYKMKVGQGSANIVEIQKLSFAREKGVYISFLDTDFGEITLNDQVTTAYDIQGTGIIFHVSMFTEQYSSLVIKNSSGAVKAEIYVYNKNASSTETPTDPTEPTEPVDPDAIAAPTGVSAYNFYAQAKGYMIKFTAATDAVSYNVYMDNSGILANITTSGDYVSASTFSAYADGGLHSLYLQSVDAQGGVSAKSSATKVRVTSETDSASDPADISRIYVVTNSGTKGGADITKAEKTSASLTIISGETAIKTVSNSGTIKRRGNSTSLADKPAYNISFDSKAEVMPGKAKGKKWCLLANAYEKTLLRNKLAMDLGLYAGGIASSAEYYADLYIDGVYKGNFVISEPAECGRSGCVYDDGKTSDEILFEWEDASKPAEEGCLYYTTPVANVRFVTEDTLDTASSRYQKWVSTLTSFENALVNTSADDMLNYIDVDSFVSMYVVNELFQTVDFGYSSVKFYITYDAEGTPTIHAGPLWDFDLSSGNSSFVENRTYDTFRGQIVNQWFRYLMQNNTFKNKVIEKYKQLQPRIQNIYKDNQLGISQITKLSQSIEASRIRNYSPISSGGAGWSESTADGAEFSIYRYSYSTVEPYSTYTYAQHIEYLTTWLKNRNEWICSQWGINPEDYYHENAISTDISITGYQISTSFGGVDGQMGSRVIYQAEPTVEGATPAEIGIIYGLVYGDNPITKEEVLYGSESEYVKSYATTEAGKLSTIMGSSTTANYYARTMEFTDDLTSDAYTSKYYVRVYAKLSDDTVVYSDVKTYTVYKVADYIYQNNMVSTKSSYDYIYNKILKKVDSSYQEGEFDWSNTIVNN